MWKVLSKRFQIQFYLGNLTYIRFYFDFALLKRWQAVNIFVARHKCYVQDYCRESFFNIPQIVVNNGKADKSLRIFAKRNFCSSFILL